MRLYHASASPYARKVRAAIHVLGLSGQVEEIEVDFAALPDALLKANPMGQVPTLVTSDGVAVFDSPVIVEYLAEITIGQQVLPPVGATRWLAMKQQALADGMADAAIFTRRLRRAGLDADHPAILARYDVIRRGFDKMEQHLPGSHPDVGKLAIASAIEFLDRVKIEASWRDTRPHLAAWYKKFMQLPCMVATA